MVHSSSAENVFYWLISFLQEKDIAIFFYQPRFGFNDLPSFLPAFSVWSVKSCNSYFPYIPPYFCPQLLAIISCWEHFLHKVAWYSWQCEAPQGWLYVRMQKNPGRKYPTEPGVFFTDLIETLRLQLLPVKLCLLLQPYPFQQRSLIFLQQLLWN